MSSWEFSESLAFEQLEPDPAAMTVRLLADLCVMFANANRDSKVKPTPFTHDDFLPNPYAPPKAEREARFAAVMADFEKGRQERLKGRTH